MQTKQRTHPEVLPPGIPVSQHGFRALTKAPENWGKEAQLVHHFLHTHFRKESAPRQSQAGTAVPGASVLILPLFPRGILPGLGAAPGTEAGSRWFSQVCRFSYVGPCSRQHKPSCPPKSFCTSGLRWWCYWSYTLFRFMLMGSLRTIQLRGEVCLQPFSMRHSSGDMIHIVVCGVHT